VAYAKLDVFCILSGVDSVMHPMHVMILTAGRVARLSTLLCAAHVAQICGILRLPVMLALILAVLSWIMGF